MHFDASPANQRSLSRILRQDPRVIRATILKMGERIEDLALSKQKTIQ
jgi:small subunit ribosomal protein S6